MKNMSLRSIQIVVVEDESIVAMDIERSLRRLGYEVPMVVDSGEEAISVAGKFLPDLILMDIQLKGEMNGIEAANEIRKLYNIPIIFLTAFADERTLQKAKEAEPYGYLLKPFQEIELHTAIEVILKKHQAFVDKEVISEEKLVLSEERFRLFIEAVKDYAIYMLDGSGNVVSWNAGAARIIGHSADEVIGKSFRVFYLPEDQDSGKPELALEDARTLGRSVTEGWRRRKDGSTFWASAALTAINDKSGNLFGYGEVVHDLTKQKQEEEALKRAIESRDEFLSIASHELKTPLTILQLQAQLFKRNISVEADDLFPKDKIQQLVELTIRQVQKLTFLVEDMLDISRIRTGRLTLRWEQFNMRELIQGMIDRYRDQFIAVGCGVPEFTYSADSVIGTWDKMRIEQVLSNIFNNAILYAKGHPVKVRLKTVGKMAQFAVEDHGEGIAKENLKKIFDRFERVVDHNEISGLGLGLFISNQIVQAHGGKIWAESEVGKGTTFFVELPLIHTS